MQLNRTQKGYVTDMWRNSQANVLWMDTLFENAIRHSIVLLQDSIKLQKTICNSAMFVNHFAEVTNESHKVQWLEFWQSQSLAQRL